MYVLFSSFKSIILELPSNSGIFLQFKPSILDKSIYYFYYSKLYNLA